VFPVFRLVIYHPPVDLNLAGEKFRWKFVESSCASHRQNSTDEKRESRRGFFPSFVSVTCHTSRFFAERDEVERLPP